MVWIPMFIKGVICGTVTLMETEVGIVGGGVVGLSLARELGNRDISCTVYEARQKIGEGADRASGILSKSGLERHGLDYSDSVVNELYGAHFHAGSGTFTVRAAEPKAYVLDRIRLAQSCAKSAEESGAEIRLGKRLDSEGIAAIAKLHRVLVGADGAVSNVASTFGFPKIVRRVLTYKAVYNGVDVEDKRMVGLYFDNSITKGFFGWTAPYSETGLEVAVGIEDRAKANGKRAFDAFTRLESIRDMLEGKEPIKEDASLIPLAARSRTVKGNVLLVGDAAGQVKATTGGGIIFGVGCAKTAAESIASHVKKGKSLVSYERDWRKRYGTDLALHRLLHGYYSSVGQTGLSMAFSFMKSLGAERLLSSFGDMDSPSRTLRGVVFRRT